MDPSAGPDVADLSDPEAVVLEHIRAFNAHSTSRLLQGLAADAVWRTGTDRFQGTTALEDLFDPWLWTLDPSLETSAILVDGNRVAAQVVEQLTIDGEVRRMDIAVFFEVRDGKIAEAKVYREGSADLAE
jgi:uncharacterized protein